MRVLLWHVHGSWTTAFVQGPHEYLLPVTPERGPDGLGRARTYTWPASAVEVTREEVARAEVDVRKRDDEVADGGGMDEGLGRVAAQVHAGRVVDRRNSASVELHSSCPTSSAAALIVSISVASSTILR